ncbi:MAG TPA: hypothetical protein VGM78_06295, partial [Ilumatobacteraceae bacterium]
AGTTLAMTSTESHEQCESDALDASASVATVVLVVATAEDLSTEPGGAGQAGAPCAHDPCPARTTRRAAYVGASDFYPDSATPPLLDLIEHEIGHTLDLPHSGDPTVDQHSSALDVMSNSAAPRDVQPQRRNAQDTIAINRLTLGWLPRSAVAAASQGGGAFDLEPSTGSAGLRLLVLPVDTDAFLTVEYLPRSGFDDFLPAGGIAVHLIDQSPAACGHPTGSPCTGIDRAQTTLGSAIPHLDLLHVAQQSWSLDGWKITLDSIAAAARVDVSATGG